MSDEPAGWPRHNAHRVVTGRRSGIAREGARKQPRPNGAHREIAQITGARTYTNVDKHLRKARARIRLTQLP